MVTTLNDLGEQGLLDAFTTLLPPAPSALLGPGDDAAVVAVRGGSVVVTVDTVVQDRDFRLEWSTGAEVGHKVVAQNLADIAAMGAVPTALLVSLAAPGDLPVAWVMDLAAGLGAAAAHAGTGVVGGDLSGADAIVISVTALGELEGRPAVRRDGARPGDVVALAGALGRSAAGLDLLHGGLTDATDPVLRGLLADHRTPRPPYEAGVRAARAGVHAMLDVSDGLVRDARRVAAASGVRIDLHRNAVLRLAAADGALTTAAAWLAGAQGFTEEARWQDWVLGGGEDHGLLACFGADTALPTGFTAVGSVHRCADAVVTLDGALTSGRGGWDHF